MGMPAIAIRRPVLTTMFFTAVVIFGLVSLFRLQVELYQGQNQNIISIVIRARGGLPPSDVERRITIPVEEAVATVSHLKNLYSNSREAESRVTMEFEPGTNMNFAALEIREKFARVRPLLPKEIEKPVIANYDDAQSAVIIFALTSESMTPEQVRDLVETQFKPVLTRVNGVASVEVYGGRERKILVEIDRDKMVSYNIPIEKVMDILGQSNVNLLAGNVESTRMEFGVRSIGAFQTIEEIGEIGIHATRQGSIIPLREIATIKDSYLEPADYARLNLEQNVTVYVKKTSMANTIPVVKTIKEVLRDFEKNMKGAVRVIIVTDKAQTIEHAISDVRSALYLGMFLIVGIIFWFLREWRLATIVLISMPISVISTFIFMDFFGISINVMTLSGLALATGILVDSAVVILENIFAKKEAGMDDATAVHDGAEEMWNPLLASLLSTLIVFLPVILIDKNIQIRYAGFTFTVCVSLIASFFVAQMLIPMLAAHWAKGHLAYAAQKSQESNTFQKQMREAYMSLIRLNLRFRYPVVIAVIIVAIFACMWIAKRDIDLPNTLEENEFSIIIFPLAGAKLEANDEAVKKIEGMLAKIPDIEMFNSTVRKDDIRVFVRLKPKNKRRFAKEEVMKILDEKGNEAIKQIHEEYSLIIDEGAGGSEQNKFVINIFGHENEALEKLAVEMANKMSKVPGLLNLVMTDLRKRPEYSLVVDKGRAAVYGITTKDVADSLHAQVRGMRPTKFHEMTRGEEIETITRLQAIYRQKLEDLKLIPVAANSGRQVPLGELGNFFPTTGPQTIDRKDKYRYVFVKGDVKRPLETIAKEVRESIRDVKLPDDYYWRFGGAYESLMKGKSELSLAFIVTIFLVYMVMACLFQSYSQPFLIMISVPLASVGIFLALAITHKPLSEHVFIGMILLAGYVVNAAIIMMDHMNHLRSKGISREQALIQAGADRLRPIMMTTMSTVLGFLPMALNIGQSSDLWSPLALTVIGGLLSSTVLTLFILPNFILISEEIAEALKKSGAQGLLQHMRFHLNFGKNRST